MQKKKFRRTTHHRILIQSQAAKPSLIRTRLFLLTWQEGAKETYLKQKLILNHNLISATLHGGDNLSGIHRAILLIFLFYLETCALIYQLTSNSAAPRIKYQQKYIYFKYLGKATKQEIIKLWNAWLIEHAIIKIN